MPETTPPPSDFDEARSHTPVRRVGGGPKAERVERNQNAGSLRLFSLFGIEVFVHWSWFVAAYVIYQAMPIVDSGFWHVVVYVGLFAIVLMHEFGHSLACLSVGGEANRIVLWPLGGVAFVKPPARPGAVLWSIAAGPLVNVGLLPVLWGMAVAAGWSGSGSEPGWVHAIGIVAVINTGLLVFNMLPIYPLDGGQVLQSILWFFVGRTKSLQIVAVIGLVCGGGIGLLALLGRSPWMFVMMLFVVWQAWQGYVLARRVAEVEAQGGRVVGWDSTRG